MNKPMHDQPMFRMMLGDVELSVLGTAHVSQSSVDAVQKQIAAYDYDVVAVELCEGRLARMLDPDAHADIDLFAAIKQGKAWMLAATLSLSAYQQRLADQLGIRPGAELHAAVEAAKANDCEVLLIDREIGTTMRRCIAAIPWWQRWQMGSGLFASLWVRDEVDAAGIERLKEGDVLDAAFSEFAVQSPALHRSLIGERDQYMALHLLQACQALSKGKVFAVVGAGHLAGMQAELSRLQEATDVDVAKEQEQLCEIPEKRSLWKLLPWLITALVLAGFALGFSRSSDLGWTMVFEWVLINGGLSALGAAIAMGHPLTVLTAFIAAPLTSLNPAIGAGMVTSASEVYLRKPRVADFSSLRKDATSLAGWRANRVTRTLMVFVLSTLGSAIGTWVAGYRIADYLMQ